MNVQYYWGDWAEESLMQAERAMHLLGMAPPEWLQNKDYYHEHVIKQVYTFHPSTNHLENNTFKLFLYPLIVVGAIWAVVALIKKNTQKKQQAEYTPIP
jgi:hypothetical protein